MPAPHALHEQLLKAAKPSQATVFIGWEWFAPQAKFTAHSQAAGPSGVYACDAGDVCRDGAGRPRGSFASVPS
jgi:hypothetical protein